jgi:hypothetical protein
MNRWIRFLSALGILAAIAVGVIAAQPGITAQEAFTASDAIAVAAAHEIFADVLANRPGWTAAAFNTRNPYGIWRVQFWDAAGEDIGWADVSPARGEIYNWEGHYDATEMEISLAIDQIRGFLLDQDPIVDLLGEEALAEANFYAEYDAWGRFWGAYIDLGGVNGVYVLVRFQGGLRDFEDPQLLGLYFNELPTYDEWYAASESQAVSVAYGETAIADAVRAVEGWTASAQLADPESGAVWAVTFYDGGTPLALATVDIVTGQIVDFAVL